MLIYNFQKEFLGIDAKDLQELGYHDLSSLRSEVTDFADLFVKTPGYIHNFQHVHWIDFIDCADDGEIQKVIINANGKNFTANLVISYAYLTDNPIEKAYLVHLQNLRTLTDMEVERIHDDILQRPAPTPAPAPDFHQEISEPQEETSIPTAASVQEFKAETQDILLTPPESEEEDIKLDLDLDIDTYEEVPVAAATNEKNITEHAVSTATTTTVHKEEQFDNGYVYNPEVASRELGLPLDLIEEFIQDFIAQAKDFQQELYAALEDGDIDNVKTLSHKLKGVAANLRIEDAFETLTVINTTSDPNIIRTNLDLFYKIIAKLAGEKIEETEELVLVEEDPIELVEPEIELALEPEPEQKQESDEPSDELKLEFKDDEMDLEFKEEHPQEEKEKEELPKIEINYSQSKVANEIGLDIESFHELFNDYINEARLLIKEMQEAVQLGNFDLLKSEVTKLKGMSDNMRINSFNDELNTLMNATDAEESLTLIEKIHDILEKLSKVGA